MDMDIYTKLKCLLIMLYLHLKYGTRYFGNDEYSCYQD